MLTVRQISPKEAKDYLEIAAILIPIQSGQIEILPGHAEAFFLLTKGKIRIMDKSEKIMEMEIEKGVCHVKNDMVMLLLQVIQTQD